MGIRQIREIGDDILTKTCKPVTQMTLRTKILINDMLDTMYEANGVGLAAPQAGVLKRIVVIDVGEGPIIMLNPEIISAEGEQTGYEGCLSVPGKMGTVTRPNVVTVRFQDENMEWQEMTGTELLARAFCHEIDHLDGMLYVDKVEGELMESSYEDDEEDEEE
jgi:peptide deformylase